jgi:hypothetical protein
LAFLPRAKRGGGGWRVRNAHDRRRGAPSTATRFPSPTLRAGGGKIRRTRRECSLLFPDPVLVAKVGIAGKRGRKRLKRTPYAEAFFKIPVKVPDRRESRHGVVTESEAAVRFHRGRGEDAGANSGSPISSGIGHAAQRRALSAFRSAFPGSFASQSLGISLRRQIPESRWWKLSGHS